MNPAQLATLFGCIAGALLFILLMVILYHQWSKKEHENAVHLIELDQYTTDCYLNQLKKMIEVNTIYEIDSYLGNHFNSNASIDTNISNEDIMKLNEKIQINIVEMMSPPMRTYLFFIFGDQWMRRYIQTYTISMLLNYTKYSIEDIAKIK